MSAYDYYTLYNCYVTWYLDFIYGKTNQTNKINKTVTRLAKRSFKAQLKNTFYLMTLKFSGAFRRKTIF